MARSTYSLLDAEAIAANPNAGAEREAARKEVLRAAREAIKLDRGYRSTLWALTNKRSFHNDLQDFAEDAEFSQVARPRAPCGGAEAPPAGFGFCFSNPIGLSSRTSAWRADPGPTRSSEFPFSARHSGPAAGNPSSSRR